jgi:hypothetical protein
MRGAFSYPSVETIFGRFLGRLRAKISNGISTGAGVSDCLVDGRCKRAIILAPYADLTTGQFRRVTGGGGVGGMFLG